MNHCPVCNASNPPSVTRCAGCGAGLVPPVDGTAQEPAQEPAPWVVLTRCRSLADADLLRCELRAAGIEAEIPDENLMQATAWNLNTYGFVRVTVRQDQLEAARSLHGEADSSTQP